MFVGIAIGPHEDLAEAMRHALHGSRQRLDIETSGHPNSHSPNVSACFLAFGHDGSNQVPSPESKGILAPHQVATGKAAIVGPGPLIAPPPRGLDDQRWEAPAGDPFDLPDAQGVEGVGLGQVEPGPIPLGPAAGGDLDR